MINIFAFLLANVLATLVIFWIACKFEMFKYKRSCFCHAIILQFSLFALGGQSISTVVHIVCTVCIWVISYLVGMANDACLLRRELIQIARIEAQYAYVVTCEDDMCLDPFFTIDCEYIVTRETRDTLLVYDNFLKLTKVYKAKFSSIDRKLKSEINVKNCRVSVKTI